MAELSWLGRAAGWRGAELRHRCASPQPSQPAESCCQPLCRDWLLPVEFLWGWRDLVKGGGGLAGVG